MGDEIGLRIESGKDDILEAVYEPPRISPAAPGFYPDEWQNPKGDIGQCRL